jgi:Arc/MetJ-type ribon-helix-helix transcriptional regulator
MQRITIRLPEQQISLLEKLVEAGEFPTVSEAIRDAVRELIEKRASRILSDSDQLSSF